MTYRLFPISDPLRTQADTGYDQSAPVIAALADGGAIVVWWNRPDVGETYVNELLAQRYGPDGSAVGGLQTILSSSSNSSLHIEPVVAGLEGGGYAVAWLDPEAQDMRVRTFDADNQELSDRILGLPDREISETRTVDVHGQSAGYGGWTITALEGGGFALTTEGSYGDILARDGAQTIFSAIFDAEGETVTAPFQVSPWIETGSYTAESTRRWNLVYESAGLADGTYAIVTRIGQTTPGNDSEVPSVAVQIRGPGGAIVRDVFLASSDPTGRSGAPAIATLTDGSFVVAWNASDATRWRRFEADGTPMGDDVSLGALYDGPTVSAFEDGGFMIGVRSRAVYAPSTSAYAFRFDATGEPLGDRIEMHARDAFDTPDIYATPEFVTLGNGSPLALWSGQASGHVDIRNILIRPFMAERIGTAGNDSLTASETATALFGREGDDSMTGAAAGDVLFGDDGADSQSGAGGDDTIHGGEGDDTIAGDEGDDLLDGDEGDDVVSAGDGDDTVTATDGNDVVSGGEGTDLLIVGSVSVVEGTDLLIAGFASDAVTVSGPEDGLRLQFEETALTVSGFESVQFIDRTLDLAMLLALRDGTVPERPDEDDLTGGYGDDVLIGGDGNDTVISGSGNNTLIGGAGDDVLRIEGSGLRIVDPTIVNPLAQPLALGQDWSLRETPDVEEPTTRPHQTLQIAGSSDTEEAFSFEAEAGQTWIFDIDGASFDTYLTLLDSGGEQIVRSDDRAPTIGAGGSTSSQDAFISHVFEVGGSYTISLRSSCNSVLSETAAATLNISVDGASGPDFGVTGSNVADGGAGDDLLIGGFGDDLLIGGLGDDSITGGEGDDTVVLAVDRSSVSLARVPNGLLVTSAVGADVIADDVETIAFDDFARSYASLDWQEERATVRVFQIALDGAQAATPTGSTGTGTGQAVFEAASRSGTLRYSLTVSGLDDITNAHIHAGARGIDGGVVFGFLSDDDLSTRFNPDGSVTATGVWDAGDGIDPFLPALVDAWPGTELELYVNINTAAFPAGEIRGQLVSAADDTANEVTGSDGADMLDGLAGDDILRGGDGDDLIRGGDGGDALFGEAGDDHLIGDAGPDTLTGGAGEDRLEGGEGDDVYIVDDTADRIVETAGAGIDEVRTSVDLSIGAASIERLIATGTDAVRLTGNGEANDLVGNAGRNTLIGSGGVDTMTGGGGGDFFVLLGQGASIEITDFAPGDALALDDRLLGLGDGTVDIRALTPDLAQGLLRDGVARFQPASGTLLLDLDGPGPEGFQPVVILGPDAALGVDDILLF